MAKESKYKVEYCEMLIDHMSEGKSLRAFCGLVRVHHQTVYNWLDKYPEFKEARDIGWDLSLLFWEELSIKLAMGENRHANATMIIYNMSNRFKNEWRRGDWENQEEKDNKITLKLAYSTPEKKAKKKKD